MGYGKKDKLQTSYRDDSRETVEQISKYQILPIKGQFSKEAAEFFGVRTAVSTSDGLTPEASYYPYYDQDNKLCGYKKRDWTKDKDEKGHFTAVGNIKVTHKLFGQHKFNEGAKRIIFVEGEGDVMATWTAIEKAMAKSGQKISYAVVGLNSGCVNARATAAANEKYLLSGEHLILGMDNDERGIHEKPNVKRGKEATEEIYATLLSKKITKITWPEGCKDAKDAVFDALAVRKDVQSFYKLVMFGGQPYVGDKIIKPSSVPFKQIIAKRPIGAHIPSMPKLMEIMRGLRKKEFTVLTAPSGAGKTTVATEMLWSLAEAGYKVGLIMLEQPSEETVKRLVARKLEVNFDLFDFDPLAYAKLEDIEFAYDHVTDPEKDSFTLVSHFGSLQVQELMTKMKTLAFVDECDYIILDHISMVVSGHQSDNERKELDILLTELAAFVVAEDVGVIAISHLNRKGTTEGFTVPRGQEDKPFWVRVRKEDLRGSSSLEQLPHYVIGIEPQIMPDRSRGPVRTVVLKNRPTRLLGVADVLKMDEKTGLLETVEVEDPDKPL